jgi:hypothetical protein
LPRIWRIEVHRHCGGFAKTAIQQEAEAREAEQRAKDKDSNMQTGCSLLTMATAGSLSQIASPTSCPSLKTSMGDANTCVVAALMTYNQNRGFAQLDRPPLHVRKQVAKACIMLIYGDSENRAEYLADKATIRD